MVSWVVKALALANVLPGIAARAAPTLEYWWRFPTTDCGYDDVQGNCSGMTVDGCKAKCDATVGCGGFNYPHGILKKTDCESKMSHEGSVSLYLKKDSPQPPPPSPPWGNLWPIPASYAFTGGVTPGSNVSSFPLVLDPSFEFVTNSSSTLLARGIERYTAILKNTRATVGNSLVAEISNSTRIHKLTVIVTSSLEEVTPTTDYSYQLDIKADGSAVAVAQTAFGALYAMETFSQLPDKSSSGALYINATSVSISDKPTYNHRGFMADTGRRFWPVSTVKAVLDAMAWSKLNVLHLHLSDNCRFALQSTQFPDLTARLTGMLGGFYTHADVAELVQYAKDRGIRIIPEVDMPGHSQGMQGLGGGNGLVFCDEGGPGSTGVPFADLQNDANGTTISTMKDVFKELSQVFPDSELFIGADETSPNGPCTVAKDYVPIETALCDYITSDLNKTVGGWEEYAFETKVAKAADNYLVNTWHYHTQFEATSNGFETIAANDSHFYLLYGQPWESYWVDIASGFVDEKQEDLLRGGIVSAWGDEYCYVAYCIHLDKFPSAHALFPPSADNLFHESIIGVAFPRTAVAAGSYWNYVEDVSAVDLATAVEVMNARITSRGKALSASIARSR